MKAVILLGSPKAQGNTARILAAITRALEAHGVRTSLYQLSAMNIGYCCGCKICEQTGRCAQSDDVAAIVEDIFQSQLVIVASPAYWGDITGQMKVFIDRCTPYGNTNAARCPIASLPLGAAVAVRAGQNKAENLHLVGTMEHFLGHLDIPLAAQFTVEGINTETDLQNRPEVLIDAYAFGEELSRLLA